MIRKINNVAFIAGCIAFVTGWACAQEDVYESAGAFDLVGDPRQLALVNGLREVSGLAMASENSVYAHNDEHGIVYEVMLADGAVKAAFAMGDPTVSADFEGIAAQAERVYLITSTGLIYESPVGVHRERVRFNVFDTGVGAFCEVEGLALADESGEFLILCKSPKVKELSARLTIYRWSLDDRMPVTEAWLRKPYSEFLSADDVRTFRPSAIEWDTTRRTGVVLSARSHQLIIINEDGTKVRLRNLDADLHAQAEGVTLTPTGELIIADEGAGLGPSRLSIYSLRR